jgi:tetratricopeptide (TPR) repeat protein
MADMDINSKLRNFLGSALEEMLAGNYEAALRDLKAAEVMDHHNPSILYNLGVNYCRLGLYRTACGYFDRLLELPGSFIEGQKVRTLCAYCRVRMADYKKAEELIDQIISLSPHDAPAHSMKGYCLEKTGNIEEAIRAYTAVLELDRDNFNALNSLACLLVLCGDKSDRALRYAQRAFASDNRNAAYCDTLGYVHLRLGNLDDAGMYLGMAEKLYPESREIREHLSLWRKQRDSGKYSGAGK